MCRSRTRICSKFVLSERAFMLHLRVPKCIVKKPKFMWQVCLATHCSIENIHWLLNLTQMWTGPLSITIFTPDVEFDVAVHVIDFLLTYLHWWTLTSPPMYNVVYPRHTYRYLGIPFYTYRYLGIPFYTYRYLGIPRHYYRYDCIPRHIISSYT